jgi:hypothetical protein
LPRSDKSELAMTIYYQLYIKLTGQPADWVTG